MKEEQTIENGEHDEESAAKSRPSGGLLADAVEYRMGLQKFRIAASNRATATEGKTAKMNHRFYERFIELEKEAEKEIREAMQAHPVMPWLKRLHGLKEVAAGLIISEIDITNKKTISQLWRFAGYGVIDGKRERQTKGQKLTYNKRLKTYVFRAMKLQVRLKGPYEKIYRQAKHRYLTTRGPESNLPEDERWTLGHCEYAALRIASKLFLSHLWHVWRDALGLPVTEPYIARDKNHDIIGPWEIIEQWEKDREASGKPIRRRKKDVA